MLTKNIILELAYANLDIVKTIGRRSMNLRDAEIGKEYIIREITTEDVELDAFLFSLGCYSGESITVILRSKSVLIVSIKDGRYSIDRQLAEAIKIS